MFDAQDLPASAATQMDAPSLPVPGGGQPAHVLDRLAGLLKHRRIAGAAFVVVVGGMMLQAYSQVAMFRTSARVVIQDERSIAVGNLNANDPMFWQETDPYYNTQYSILRSRGLAKRVVRRLQLQNHPLFNGSAPRRQGLATMVADARSKVTGAVRSLIQRQPAGPPVEPPSPDEDAAEAARISQFLGGVRIVPEAKTKLVEIIYESSDPQFAALAANTLAEEYTAQNLDQRLASVQKNLRWMSDEVTKQEKKVSDAEAAMTQYRQDQNALSLGERQNITIARLNALNETVTRQRTERIQKEATYQQLKSVDPASDAADGFPVVAANPGVVETKNRLTDLLAEKTRLSSKYLPSHPEMQKIDLQIKNARETLTAQRARVIETVKNDYQTAVTEERSFSASLEQQKNEAMDLERKGGGYVVLQRQADSDRLLWQSLLQQQKELQVVSNSRSNNVQVMDRADVPGAPFSPNTRRDWFTAMMAGMLAALGLAFGIEYLDDTVKTPEDVSKRLGLPLLGLVPAIKGARVPLLSETVPHDFGEAFRSLRTSLVFTAGAGKARVIAVTSTQPLEGKTTTACNLATALALGGSRVLLIDADMRRPGLHRIMGVENNVGLSELLVAQARVREAVQATTEPNLFVIAAGHTPPNPSELLASDRMKSFLANLTQGPFDWVVLDTPPVLAVTDAVVLAGMVSAVVFVVGSEMTRRSHAERALATLRAGRPRSIGVVLNRVDFDRNKYYYARYYGYNYKSYYGSASPAA